MGDKRKLEEQIKANSRAWHSGDEREKKALEASNRELYAQLDAMNGTLSVLDPSTGTWSVGKREAVETGASKQTAAMGTGYDKYTGGNEELDRQLEHYGQQYQKGRTAALSGDERGVTAMREANDKANQLRNQYGYGAESAEKDIETVRSRLGTVLPTATKQAGDGVRDHSSYLQAMNEAQQAKALQALKAAYDKNLFQLEKTRQALPEQYQQARNQAAASQSRQQKAFQEYAAANGLNSGTGGQAQLAYGTVLQSTLAQLTGQEQAALNELDQQRQQVGQDYQNAIAQARMSGDAQLAQALYEEQLRVDEALRDQLEQQAKQAYQQAQLDWEKARQEREWTDEADRRWEDALLEYANRTGDYSGLRGSYTEEQLARLTQAWQDSAAEEARSEAWEEAQRKAKYGDYSGLRALGVDLTTLLAQRQAKTTRSSGRKSSTGKRGEDSDTEGEQSIAAGSEGLSARNFAAVKQSVGRYIGEGEVGRATLESNLSSLWGSMSDSQRGEIEAYIRALGGSLLMK